VIVDGLTASGKTSFGHELAASIRSLDRSTLRASLDDFKKPWSDARAKGYDRLSGEGYYRNAPDFESAVNSYSFRPDQLATAASCSVPTIR
jgi:uridine kinase